MVGLDRYYETMVFRASRQGIYWDAEVTAGEIPFEAPWSLGRADETSDEDANRMHEVVVAEFSGRMMAGETFEK